MKKKNKRRKKRTLKRKDRLQVGKQWIITYEGENYLKGYKKKFSVDTICALKELQMLGMKFDEEYIKQVTESEIKRIEANKARLQRKKEKEEMEELDSELFGSDDVFSFIAGYTSGGVPYGIRWDEVEFQDEYDDDELLPF